jgi:hypothetical protein
MRPWGTAWLAAALILASCNSPSTNVATLPAPQRISGPLTFPAACSAGETAAEQPGEPSLAVDPTNEMRLLAAWLDNRTPDTVGIVVALSEDAGKTWNRSILQPLLSCASGPYLHASDPWVSIGPDGVMYVASLVRRPAVQTGTPFDVAVNVSRDHGKSWEAPAVIDSAVSPPTQLDKESILADRRHAGVVYAAWANYQAAPGAEPSVDRVIFGKSSDGGRSWSKPAVIYSGNDEAQENQLLMTAGGVLLDVFVEGSSLPAGSSPPPLPVTIRVLRSTDQGKTWSAPIDAATFTYTTGLDPGNGSELRTSGQNIVATVSGNALYVCWFEDHRDFSSILVARSDDAGKTWERPSVVVREKAEAFLPTIAVAGDGTLGALWFDLRHYVAGSNALTTDIWFSTSRDRGAHWSERHAAGPFDLRTAPHSRLGPFIGDYMGLVGVRSGFVAAYVMSKPPSRSDPTAVFVSRIPG